MIEHVGLRPEQWRPLLERWTRAGLVDAATQGRIEEFEKNAPPPSGQSGLRWPVMVALVFGGVLSIAGVILFVAANWDKLSPQGRTALVFAMVGIFHVAGALVEGSFPALSLTLHGIGTGALGAGIALVGQIYHLESHWSGLARLWFVGALAGFLVLRQWPQLAWMALLGPVVVIAEMDLWLPQSGGQPAAGFTLLLALAFLIRAGRENAMFGNTLGWIGGIALIPAAVTFVIATGFSRLPQRRLGWNVPVVDENLWGLAWAAAIVLPLFVLVWRHRAIALPFWALTAWVMLFSLTAMRTFELVLYAECVVAVGLMIWIGVHFRQKSALNFGFAFFAMVVIAFYFDQFWGQLDRSLVLLAGGLLFLGLAWALEKARRTVLKGWETV